MLAPGRLCTSTCAWGLQTGVGTIEDVESAIRWRLVIAFPGRACVPNTCFHSASRAPLDTRPLGLPPLPQPGGLLRPGGGWGQALDDRGRGGRRPLAPSFFVILDTKLTHPSCVGAQLVATEAKAAPAHMLSPCTFIDVASGDVSCSRLDHRLQLPPFSWLALPSCGRHKKYGCA